ncbi:hypothetical protein KCU88_g2407, partial [Aureobasidium melanogenum]
MQLTASTVAAILAFTVAQVGALPSPQQPTTGDSVAATTSSSTPAAPPNPTAESGAGAPVYYPEEADYPEDEAYYVVEKRWTPSNHPSGQGQHPGAPSNGDEMTHSRPGAGAAGHPHPYRGQHYGGPGFGPHGGAPAHGPMASESDEYDDDYDYDYEDDDDQATGHLSRRGVDVDDDEEEDGEDYENENGKRLDRRFGFKIKQFKWWQHQTMKPLDFVVGNPNIRNLNFKDGARTTPLGVGMRRRRRDVPAPGAGQQGEQNTPATPDDTAYHGIAQDADGNYYFYYPEEQEEEAKN